MVRVLNVDEVTGSGYGYTELEWCERMRRRPPKPVRGAPTRISVDEVDGIRVSAVW